MGFTRMVDVDFGPVGSMSVLPTRWEPRVKREDLLDEAMDRYASGEDAAFSVLYTGLESKLRSFLMRLTGTLLVAEDLLQETFMRIHRARGGFAPGAAVVPWAYAIARNAWLDHVRSAKVRGRPARETRDLYESASLTEPLAGPETDSEQLAIARETAALVEAVLARLPVAQREAFVLLRYEGMSVVEAAEVLGSTKSAVKLRAFRAYEALRASLDEHRRAKGGGDGT
jgi:RNA polymerase sigma-70 factor (ECF subfamily)